MWRAAILLCLIQYTFADVVIEAISGTPPLLPDSIFCGADGYDVFYVDYLATGNQSSIFRYSIEENQIYGAYVDGYDDFSFLVPVHRCDACNTTKMNLFMVGSATSAVVISWDGCSPIAEFVYTLFTLDLPDEGHTDTGVQNQAGQFFMGTTTNAYCSGPSNSSLYAYSEATGTTPIFDGYTATTGMSFGADGTIYHVDICSAIVNALQPTPSGHYTSSVAFDFNTIGPKMNPSFPDIDTDGNLYVPCYLNGTIYKVNPSAHTAKLLLTLPEAGVEGACFCGPQRDTLYIVMSAVLIDPFTLDFVGSSDTPPLYKVTGLNATGTVSSGVWT